MALLQRNLFTNTGKSIQKKNTVLLSFAVVYQILYPYLTVFRGAFTVIIPHRTTLSRQITRQPISIRCFYGVRSVRRLLEGNVSPHNFQKNIRKSSNCSFLYRFFSFRNAHIGGVNERHKVSPNVLFLLCFFLIQLSEQDPSQVQHTKSRYCAELKDLRQIQAASLSSNEAFRMRLQDCSSMAGRLHSPCPSFPYNTTHAHWQQLPTEG